MVTEAGRQGYVQIQTFSEDTSGQRAASQEQYSSGLESEDGVERANRALSG